MLLLKLACASGSMALTPSAHMKLVMSPPVAKELKYWRPTFQGLPLPRVILGPDRARPEASASLKRAGKSARHQHTYTHKRRCGQSVSEHWPCVIQRRRPHHACRKIMPRLPKRTQVVAAKTTELHGVLFGKQTSAHESNTSLCRDHPGFIDSKGQSNISRTRSLLSSA